jgi:hypothetical protein
VLPGAATTLNLGQLLDQIVQPNDAELGLRQPRKGCDLVDHEYLAQTAW